MDIVKKTIRLNKASKECNVSMDTILQFLYIHGYNYESNPNTKISEEAYKLLQSEFKTDINTKAEIEKKENSQKTALTALLKSFYDDVNFGAYGIEMAIYNTVGFNSIELDNENNDLICKLLLRINNIKAWNLLVKLNNEKFIDLYISGQITSQSDENKLLFLNDSFNNNLLSNILSNWTSYNKNSISDLIRITINKKISPDVISNVFKSIASSIFWTNEEIWKVLTVCKTEKIIQQAIDHFSFRLNDSIEKLQRLALDNSFNQNTLNIFKHKLLIEIDDISSDKLIKILKVLSQSNGDFLVAEIINIKISNISIISKSSVDEILKSIQLITNLELTNNLWNNLTGKLLNTLSKYDLVNEKKTAVESFKLFLKIYKNKKYNQNYDFTIQKFNELVSEDTQFILWQETQYFQPTIEFFKTHFSKLSYTDFLKTSNKFHKEYFDNHLSMIKEFETIESFGLLTMLIIETPLNTVQDIFPKLSTKYQAAYWLNFSKSDVHSRLYDANYEASDIPFKPEFFISYLDDETSINDLYFAFELIRKIQEEYKLKKRNSRNNDGYFKLDNQVEFPRKVTH